MGGGGGYFNKAIKMLWLVQVQTHWGEKWIHTNAVTNKCYLYSPIPFNRKIGRKKQQHTCTNRMLKLTKTKLLAINITKTTKYIHTYTYIHTYIHTSTTNNKSIHVHTCTIPIQQHALTRCTNCTAGKKFIQYNHNILTTYYLGRILDYRIMRHNFYTLRVNLHCKVSLL